MPLHLRFTSSRSVSAVRRTLLALAFASTAGIGYSQSENLVENGDFKSELSGWKVYSHLRSKKPDTSIVEGPVRGSSALQVTIPEAPDLKKYQVGFSQPISRQIEAGETITLRFTARSPESLNIAGLVHTIAEPHQNKLYKQFALTPTWESYEFSAKKPVAFAQNEAQLEFFLSFAAGQVEITNIEIFVKK